MSGDKKTVSVWRMMLVLAAFCVGSGALLAWVYSVTKEPIAKAASQGRIDAIAKVLPSFDNNPLEQTETVEVEGADRPLAVYPAFSDGRFVGAAVESYSMNGFSGEIDVMYGFDADGRVVDYQVIKHAETPGLGAKMSEWFRMPQGRRSIIGYDMAHGQGGECAGDSVNWVTSATVVSHSLSVSFTPVTVNKDGGDVDGITAATITSRAFLDALNRAYSAYVVYCDTNNIH